MAVSKTQAMRLLERKGISYARTTYDDDGKFHSAGEVAGILGLPLSSIYKSLVVLPEGVARGRPMIVMIPSDAQLDLKALAEAVGEKKLRMATQREAEELTGMQVGGISVLGLRKPAAFDVYIDERALELDTIHISAGERGTEIALSPDDLVSASGAKYVRL